MLWSNMRQEAFYLFSGSVYTIMRQEARMKFAGLLSPEASPRDLRMRNEARPTMKTSPQDLCMHHEERTAAVVVPACTVVRP